MAEQVQMNLLSFQRKTINSYQLKADIRATGAVLMRKGRSRNWILQADNEQIQQIIAHIEQAEQPSWLWLIKVLNKQHQQLTSQQLLNLVERNPAISLNQLIGLTNCTRAQAREAMDQFEWL
ncbi:MAG: hypothetical protein HRU23_14080 [Gammaproteobacteria bacterium]|nr:hypothetical protein [Gammaproteobacteria bacterium]